MGFAGCALVIASQYEEFPTPPISPGGPVALSGAALAVCASLATSLSAYLFRWASALAETIPKEIESRRGNDSISLEMFCVAIGVVISDLFSMTLNASIRIAFGESAGLWTLFAGVSAGVFIYALGSMAWRIANLTTSNLGTNALGYASPVIALALLWVFSQAVVSSPGLLVIGTVAVVASNLLINFEGEIRWGFRALLLSVGICGAFVYLHESFFAILRTDD